MNYVHHSRRAIAVKLHPLAKDEMGLAKLLFVYNEDNEQWEIPDKNQFIQENIWIRGGYSLIDSKYDDGQVFELTNITKTAFDKENSTKPESYCDWCANGRDTRALPDSEMVPIYDLPLPDIDSGEITVETFIPYLRIFIRNDDFVYGPFNISQNAEGTLIATPYEMALNLEGDHIAKIPAHTLADSGSFLESPLAKFGINGFVESLLSMKNSCRDKFERIDFINSVKLVKWVSNTKRKGERQRALASKKVIEGLLADLKAVKLSEMADLSVHRYNRAIKLLQQEDTEIDFLIQLGDQLINEALNTPQGKKALKSIAETLQPTSNQSISEPTRAQDDNDEAVIQHNQRMQKLSALEDQLESQIRKQELRLTELKEEEQVMLKQREAVTAKNLSAEIQKLVDDRSQLQTMFTTLNNAFEELTQKHNLAKTFDHLRSECNRLEANKSDLINAISAQAEQIASSTFAQDLTRHFTLAKILTERSYTHQSSTDHEYTAPLYLTTIPTLGADLVGAINQKFNESPGRIWSDIEMANLLICMQQNLLTALHGKPGSGKTSTVLRLSHALNLVSQGEENSDNFINIAVSRGWTSSRDFIGFFNSLKGIYQPSRTGMYQFLMNATHSGITDAFRIALMDEANLSQIEYYWSDFISMCDAEGWGRSIDLGLPNRTGLIAPNGPNSGAMRFIATLNNDDTTEPLSPRLIDRAAIINMDVSATYSDFGGRYVLDGAISKTVMQNFFGVNPAQVSEMKEAEDYSIIKLILEKAMDTNDKFGDPLSISYRKRIAIRNYLSTAITIMDSENIAQDFAISQFILPSIKGESQAYKARLEELAAIASRFDLPRTKEILRRIITEGEAYLHSYSFV